MRYYHIITKSLPWDVDTSIIGGYPVIPPNHAENNKEQQEEAERER